MVDKPIAKVRDGALEVACWQNLRKKEQAGKTIEYTTYNLTASRMYVDKDGNPKNTTSFREGDALKMAELWRDAYKMTRELRAKEKQEKQDRAPPKVEDVNLGVIDGV
jgi:RNA polymerase-interacting CarD/CdnL/TRCF family regulator